MLPDTLELPDASDSILKAQAEISSLNVLGQSADRDIA